MQAYSLIEPFGSIEDDYHTALISRTIAESAGRMYDNPPKLRAFMREPVLTEEQEIQREKNMARRVELNLMNNSQIAERNSKNG